MRVTVLCLVAASLATSAAARCPADATTAAYEAAGPYAVGVRKLTLVDPTRTTPAHASTPELPQRTLTTEVWYPTDGPGGAEPVRDAPLASGGPFPLVVSSHGLLDTRFGEAYYAVHLARRGFVVAAPEFPLTNGFVVLATGAPLLDDLQHQPGDVSFVIDQLLALSGTPAGWLFGGVDPDRIGVVGLSLGGATTVLVTYHPTLADPRVRASLPIAPAGGCALTRGFFHHKGERRSRVPLLILHGTQDLLVPFDTNALPLFRFAPSPRKLVALVDASHTAFSGISGSSQTSYDARFGCPAIAAVAQWGDPFTGLGPPFDTASAARCALPCQGPIPTNPPMQATTQHDLTRAVVAAFFESTLAYSKAAACFLRHGLAAGNAGAVRVRSR